MRHKRLIVLAIAALVLMSLVLSLGPAEGVPGVRRGGPVIGLIYLEGPFVTGRSAGGLFDNFVGSDRIVNQLEEVLRDPSVRAVVIRINSPGGSAAAAQEVAAAVNRLKERLPVVSSLADVAASGGYWVAAQTNAIVANPATMTGSIGVIMEIVNLEDLFDKLGVDHEVFKSGPHKDMGATTRTLTGEERQILQGMIDDIFDQFVDAVATGRDMDRTVLLPLADGRVFTGRQALAYGLVDYLGDLEDAIQLAAQLAGLDQWTVRVIGQATRLERFLGILGGSSGLLPANLTTQIWWGRQVVRFRKPN